MHLCEMCGQERTILHPMIPIMSSSDIFWASNALHAD